jgi:hypothetical protein
MPTKDSEALVLTSKQNGIVVISTGTELTRLNYFDGKFLRASDLKAEQDYLRHLVQESNQAGGAGVTHGFDVTLGTGDTLNIGPGLAIDAEGRVLLMPQGVSIGVQELIEKSRDLEKLYGKPDTSGGSFGACEESSGTPPVNTTNPNNIFKIVISAAEALCGEEDVYGKLCEEACSTSTDRPLIIEGVVIRALPLGVSPTTKGQINQANLRSRTAAAYFEFERSLVSSLISGEGLKQQTWCLGANAATDGGVPIGVFARAGSATVFLDPWIVRRELIDTPPRRYWQWRMAMRPWDVFLAQILQFQCQLRDLYKTFPNPGTEVGPCSDAKDAINEAKIAIEEIRKYYESTSQRLVEYRKEITPFEGGSERLLKLNDKLASVYTVLTTTPADRWLINGGIIELPSAGYLPVVPGTAVTVNQQVQKMMGEGVDLRFCVVRPDFVAHALEEAQHMERISLIDGLENPALKPQVDILIPDGEVTTPAPEPEPQTGFEVKGEISSVMQRAGETGTQTVPLPLISLQGAARGETAGGGTTLYLSAASRQSYVPAFRAGVSPPEWNKQSKEGFPNVAGDPPVGLWLSIKCDADLFNAKQNDVIKVSGETLVAARDPNFKQILEFSGEISGDLGVKTVGTDPQHIINGEATLTYKAVLPEPAIDEQHTDTSVYETDRPTVDDRRFVTQLNKGKVNIELGVNTKTLVTYIKCEVVTTPKLFFSTKLTATLAQSTNVFLETNPSHITALQSLKSISDATNQPSFVAEKTKLLFPAPPTKDAGAPEVRATRDWVLFHRRRTKECTGTVAAASRHYQVYEFAGTPDQLKELDKSINDLVPSSPLTAAELKNVTAKDLKGFSLIGEVSFGSGSANFTSDLSTLKSKWTKVSGGQILWGAIGSRGDAANDGESLSQNRLKALESALDTVSPTARADVLPLVPPLLENTSFDGVIVLVNGAAAKRRYRVFELTQTKLTQMTSVSFIVDKFLNDPNGWETAGLVTPAVWNLFDEVGTVTFGSGSSTLSDPAVLTGGWKSVPSGHIARAGICSRDDAINDGDTLAVARIKSVEDAVNATTKTDGNARADVIKQMPPLNDAGVDGLMFFLVGKYPVPTPPPQPPPPPYGSQPSAIGGGNL